MSKRTPLDLKQKWFVAQYWAQMNPPLTRSSYAVLMRLLDRQNTKTGRCDPSAIGLAEETGFTERSVRSAFKELEERGAVKRYRAAKRSRNQFLIHSVEELGQIVRLSELRSRSGRPSSMNSTSARPAARFRSTLKCASPETIKETIKKKRSAERETALTSRSLTEKQAASKTEMDLGEFEKRVVKVFEREGYGYEGLLSLPATEIEAAHGEITKGVLSFSNAVGRLLKKYRSEVA
ncbi:helix-turn-helix domain-containing protein [uncultured Aliiroseovarius sp.]|uniref:helix-turn-helix domain-containing protein n=1 Tax=uncultured Aliiroseovarius sp. TaxID=1658783 RepID=UPI002625194C|nr:helix-turn-helix domain-containing protein [uncultured Aliiroseovarius sp.]